MSTGGRESDDVNSASLTSIYAKDIAGYIENKYAVSYTVAGVTKLLYKLGFTYKKPQLIPGKFDPEKQEEWKLQYALLKGNKKKRSNIFHGFSTSTIDLFLNSFI